MFSEIGNSLTIQIADTIIDQIGMHSDELELCDLNVIQIRFEMVAKLKHPRKEEVTK